MLSLQGSKMLSKSLAQTERRKHEKERKRSRPVVLIFE
jgi:hypothetical protein